MCEQVYDYAGVVRETVEREVKLAAREGFTLPELGGEARPTRVFVSTYHDTADLALARHRITFRHRVEDGAGVWQLKLPRAGDVRVELERAGPPAVPAVGAPGASGRAAARRERSYPWRGFAPAAMSFVRAAPKSSTTRSQCSTTSASPAVSRDRGRAPRR